MIAFLLADANFWFSFAIGIVLVLCIIEAAGLLFGISLLGVFDDITTMEMSADLDASPDTLTSLGNWLCLDKLPLMIWLVLLLTSFAITGYCINYFYAVTTSFYAPLWLSFVVSLIVSLVITSRVGGAIANLLPKNESSAVNIDDFVGATGHITYGTARSGSPAEAKLIDQYQQPHYVMVEPMEKEDTFQQGDKIILVQKQPSSWLATRYR